MPPRLTKNRPDLAINDPAALAWSAQMLRVAIERRTRRLAREATLANRETSNDADGGERDGESA